MELVRLSLRGITSFTSAQPVVIDFDSFGEGLIAFVGKNGAGKTTLIEAIVASLFEEFPSRPGTLYQCAHGRDAFIETTWREDGQEIVARIQIDAEKRTSEKFLFVNGQSVTTGRAKEFAAEIRKRFGSLDLLLASVFMSLRSRGNFLLLPKGQRKELFAELLGLGYLSHLSEACGNRRKSDDLALGIQRTLIDTKRADLNDLFDQFRPSFHDIKDPLASLEAYLKYFVDTHDNAKTCVEEGRTLEVVLIGKVERARGAEEEVQGLRDAFATAELDCARLENEYRDTQDRGRNDLAQLEQQLTAWLKMRDRLIEEAEADLPDRYVARQHSLDERIASLESVCAEEPAIIAAKEHLQALSAEQEHLTAEERKLTALTSEWAQARMSVSHAKNLLATAQVTRKTLISRRDSLVASLNDAVDADAARVAIRDLETEREHLGEAEQAYAELKSKLAQAKNALALAAERVKSATIARDKEHERLERAAARLSEGPCTTSATWEPTTPTFEWLSAERNIEFLGYAADRRILFVQFRPRELSDEHPCYQISNVDPTIWHEFKQAENKGKFYAARIRHPFESTTTKVAIAPAQFRNGHPAGLSFDPALRLREICPVLEDARQSSREFNAFDKSSLQRECMMQESLWDALGVECEDLLLAVEAEERDSVSRRDRLAHITGKLRDAQAIIAMETFVADRRRELVAINEGLIDDPTAKQELALAEAEKYFTELDRRLSDQKPRQAGWKPRLLEIDDMSSNLRRQIARESLVEDAKLHLPVLKLEQEGLAAEEAREREALLARQQETDSQIEKCESITDLTKARVLFENGQAQERLAAATELSQTRAQALVDAQDRFASFAGLQSELDSVRQVILQAEQEVATTHESIVKLQGAIAEYVRKSGDLEELEMVATHAAHQVALWGMLETALGPDGAQALEIDAAGPEVARLANELLEFCYGSPRFSIQFETLREKVSKRGEYREVFDVRVFDRGQERDVALLSSGESVVVGESIGLALAIYNARKNKIRYRVIFRDETVGPLDPENAQAYLTMLRRAMVLGGFKQVLFVAHPPEVWQGADTCLFVKNGRVSMSRDAGVTGLAGGLLFMHLLKDVDLTIKPVEVRGNGETGTNAR